MPPVPNSGSHVDVRPASSLGAASSFGSTSPGSASPDDGARASTRAAHQARRRSRTGLTIALFVSLGVHVTVLASSGLLVFSTPHVREELLASEDIPTFSLDLRSTDVTLGPALEPVGAPEADQGLPEATLESAVPEPDIAAPQELASVEPLREEPVDVALEPLPEVAIPEPVVAEVVPEVVPPDTNDDASALVPSAAPAIDLAALRDAQRATTRNNAERARENFARRLVGEGAALARRVANASAAGKGGVGAGGEGKSGEARGEAQGGASFKAQLIASTTPEYPRLAKARGIEGHVECRMRVAADGRVTNVEIVTSSGHKSLDQAAVKALSTWRYRAPLRDGKPIETYVLHRVVFKLK